MSAANTDKFIKGARRWSGQIGASGVGDGSVTTIPLVVTTGLPTDTAVQLSIDRVDSSGTLTPSREEVIRGVVSGNNIIDCVRGVEGTAQAHNAGAVVECILTADQWNNEKDALLTEHGQDGKHTFSGLTAKTTPVDADLVPLVDSAASFLLKKITWAYLKIAIWAGLKPPEGFTINIKFVPSVASNNLTVALKGLDGNDHSATNPGYVMIGGTLRTITAALSVTKNAATNWCNAGSAELATKEIDYFTYLGYNATDGVVIGFSRIPSASSYDDFSATTTNEKYCAISTITNAAATDYYSVIGRFAATLSAGAGYTWSVPTYTAKNLIQRPIHEGRSITSAIVSTIISGSGIQTYKVVGSRVFVDAKFTVSAAGAGSPITLSLPFTSKNDTNIEYYSGVARFNDTGVNYYTALVQNTINTNYVRFQDNNAANYWVGNRAGLGNLDTFHYSFNYEI